MTDTPAPPQYGPVRIGDEAPNFCARTTQGNLTLSTLQGHWVLIFAHPADFTPVCTSEFLSLSRSYAAFHDIDCALLGLSVDSLSAHFAWISAIRSQFGVDIPFPIIEDPSMAIAQAYGMLDPAAQDSATVRAVVVIDPQGMIRAMLHYPANIGRSVPELLRLVTALQEADRTGMLTPESWAPGTPLILPPIETQAELEASGTAWFLRPAPEASS